MGPLHRNSLNTALHLPTLNGIKVSTTTASQARYTA